MFIHAACKLYWIREVFLWAKIRISATFSRNLPNDEAQSGVLVQSVVGGSNLAPRRIFNPLLDKDFVCKNKFGSIFSFFPPS